MKTLKSFFSIFLFAFLAVAFIPKETDAQGIVGVKSIDFGTVANSVDEAYKYYSFAGLLKEFGCAKIDSIIISMTVKNETDIDTLNWYPVNWTVDGTAVLGTVITYTVTLNVAAAGTGTQILYTANHGVQAASFRGYEGFTVFTRGAAAGNDATDPNSCKVTITFWGS